MLLLERENEIEVVVFRGSSQQGYVSSSSLKLFVGSTVPSGDQTSMGSLGDVKTQLPEVQPGAIYLVSGLLTHVIFSTAFFPFENYGKKLILCLEDFGSHNFQHVPKAEPP